MAQIKTFVAVDISKKIQTSVVRTISQLSATAVDYNWLTADGLHLTLNFLGDVEDTQIPAVCRLIEKTVTEFGSFEMCVKGLGCFPNPEKPRVVWLGVEQGTEELTALHEKLAIALETMRFPRERNDYRPHLTLGRLRRGGRWNPSLTEAVNNGSNLSAGCTVVDQVVIYSSFLDRTGPTYTAMSRIDLV